jgi:hypothetical protein
VLRVELGATSIDLHPFLTVVRGLDGAERRRFVAALAALPTGAVGPASGGLVEAHGIVLDLTPRSLALLDLPGDGDLPVDVVVRGRDVPGPGDDVDARRLSELEAARTAAANDVDRAADALERARRDQAAADAAAAVAGAAGDAAAALTSVRAEVEAAAARLAHADEQARRRRLEHEAAQATLAAREREADEARSARTGASAVCSAAVRALEDLHAARDPLAPTSLDAARERLAELEAAGRRTAPVEGDPVARAEELRRRRSELEAALLAIDVIDPYPVEVALARVRADDPTELVASVEAIELADELERLDAALGSASSTLDAAGADDVADARRRLDEARTALADAEEAVRQPDLDRNSLAELERAHDAVLEALEGADRRFGGERARRRLDQARASEQEVLDRLGFRSYTDYLLGTSVIDADPAQERRVDEARAQLREAERAWERLSALVEADLARAELRQRWRDARAEATELLGHDPGDQLDWALRQHRVPLARREETARLLAALEAAGLALAGEDVPDEVLADLAETWLAEHRATTAQRGRLERELADLDVELALATQATRERELAAAAAAHVDDADVGRRTLLDEARAAVTAAEQRVARHRQAEAEVVRLKQVLEGAADDERRAVESVTHAEAALAAATTAERQALVAATDASDESAAATAAHDRAVAALDDLETRLAAARDGVEPVAELAAAASEAAAATGRAEAALVAARAAAESLASELDDARRASTAPAERAPLDPAQLLDQIEWYLLARLAAQRAVSYAGSVPLVVDDALRGLRPVELERLLERLERGAQSVQVVVLTDDATAAAWASGVGPDRAAVVEPSFAPTA